MSAYPVFRSTRGALKGLRRKRSLTVFILEGNENPDCRHCGQPIHDFSGQDADGKALHPPGYQGNRCLYVPRAKRVAAMHYTCAWKVSLDAIANRMMRA